MSLAGPEERSGEEEEAEKEGTDGGGETEGEKAPEKDMELEDATDIALFIPYQWQDWSVVRSRDCLYLWSEFCAIELSNVSNGWFRFLVDNKLATMYSSGSTEGGPDSSGEFERERSWCSWEKVRRVSTSPFQILNVGISFL